MSWDNAIDVVRPHVVKIETPSGYGTGFLSFYNDDKTWCGIATAAHVVAHADQWREPIRVRHEVSGAEMFLQSTDRVIILDYPTDSAIAFFFKGDLQLPEVPITLMPVGEPCPIGADIGWLGYPNIEPHTMCFFAGTISARKPDSRSYLVDGVAINGVSGGPVFHCPDQDRVRIIGCVSAYHANRATGEALPGLLRAQDVSHFHDVARMVRDVDAAREQKEEFEAEREKPEDAPNPETSSD